MNIIYNAREFTGFSLKLLGSGLYAYALCDLYALFKMLIFEESLYWFE